MPLKKEHLRKNWTKTDCSKDYMCNFHETDGWTYRQMYFADYGEAQGASWNSLNSAVVFVFEILCEEHVEQVGKEKQCHSFLMMYAKKKQQEGRIIGVIIPTNQINEQIAQVVGEFIPNIYFYRKSVPSKVLPLGILTADEVPTRESLRDGVQASMVSLMFGKKRTLDNAFALQQIEKAMDALDVYLGLKEGDGEDLIADKTAPKTESSVVGSW